MTLIMTFSKAVLNTLLAMYIRAIQSPPAGNTTQKVAKFKSNEFHRLYNVMCYPLTRKHIYVLLQICKAISDIHQQAVFFVSVMLPISGLYSTKTRYEYEYENEYGALVE